MEWRAIPETNGRYEISESGEIRGIRKYRLRPNVSPHGYRRVGISRNGHWRHCFLHRLVAEAFIGPCPKGYHVNHIDGDPSNSHYSNLEYTTPAENLKHSWHVLKRHRPIQGSKHGRSKLTETQVVQIRQMHAQGVAPKVIAETFGINRSNVSYILTNKTWKHIL